MGSKMSRCYGFKILKDVVHMTDVISAPNQQWVEVKDYLDQPSRTMFTEKYLI